MIKYPVFIALVISISVIWLSPTWQAAEAFGRAQTTPEPTPVVTPVGPQPEVSANTAPSGSEAAEVLGLNSVGPLTLIAAILLTLAIVGFALAVIFMAAHKYSEWLNREMPQPVYTQEKRLLKVIGDSVKEIIQQTMGKDRVTGQERDVQLGIVEFERTANAGVNLKLNSDTLFEEATGEKLYRQLQSWRIEADRWGRIKKMSQEGVPRYILVEKAPVIEVAKIDEEKKTENGKLELPIPAGMLTPGGEQSNSWSSTTIAVFSTRKHWMD